MLMKKHVCILAPLVIYFNGLGVTFVAIYEGILQNKMT